MIIALPEVPIFFLYGTYMKNNWLFRVKLKWRQIHWGQIWKYYY